MSVIGKDDKNRIWFKSDWFLSDITEAIDFKVENHTILWWPWFRLVATVPYNRDFHGPAAAYPTPKYFNQTIGWYESLKGASMAMETLLILRGIREIDPLSGEVR
jgi:hypothetical protein